MSKTNVKCDKRKIVIAITSMLVIILIKEIESYDGAGKSKIQDITYQLILSLLDSQRVEMAEKGISKNMLLHTITLLDETFTSQSKAENRELLAEVRENVNMTYVQKEKRVKEAQSQEQYR